MLEHAVGISTSVFTYLDCTQFDPTWRGCQLILDAFEYWEYVVDITCIIPDLLSQPGMVRFGWSLLQVNRNRFVGTFLILDVLKIGIAYINAL